MADSEKVHAGKHLQKYIKNTPWYLLSSLLTKAMGFILLPIFTNYLTPEEFGTLSTIESLGRVLPIFISIYLDASFNRFYYKERELSNDRVRLLFSSHFWFILFWGLGVCLSSLFILPSITDGLNGVTLPILIIVVFTQLMNQLAIMTTLIWRANLLAKRLAIFQISISIISLLLTIYLLTFVELGWVSRVYALSGMAFLQFIVLIFIAVKNEWLRFEVDFSLLKRSLKFCLPLVPNIAAGWVAMFSDRLILAHYDKLGEAGIYSIAAQIAMLMYVINDAITKVQGPIAMSGMIENLSEAKAKMASFTLGYLSIITVFYLSLVLFSKEVVYYFTNANYLNAFHLVPILAMVYIFSGVYRVFTNVVSFHNQMWIISASAFIQVFINLLLNFIFIPKFGMYAAAYSTLISIIAYTAFIFIASQRISKIILNYIEILKLIVLVAICLLVVHLLNNFFEVGYILLLIKFIILFCIIYSSMCLKSNKYFKDKLSKFFASKFASK